MKALILAAGEGHRMRPLTNTRPKVMLPLANKPIMEHLLVELSKAGIREFIIVIGYQGESIRSFFQDGNKWGVHINYVTQDKRAGTAHAVKMTQGLLESNFLTVNGDIIVKEEDIRQLISRNVTALSLVKREKVEHLGVVEVTGDQVVRLHEKVAHPPSHLANAGVYLFTPRVFEAINQIRLSPRGEYELPDVLQWLIDHGDPITYHMISYWEDLSHPWDLLNANEQLMNNLLPDNQAEVEPNVVLKGSVSVGQGTVIRSNSYIVGPVIIGQSCQIGPNCYVRPHTVIGDGCHIGSAVEIKNSIIMSGTKIPHLSYVGDSIIGENCNFGAGTKIANLRLDKKEIKIQGINTGRTKLGAIIGDGVQTGINVTINVGSMVGNNTFVAPGLTITGMIGANSRVMSK